MKKVVYSIRKVRNSNEKLSGLGFINDEGTLFCKCVSKNGKQYTRAFDDVDKHCFPVFGKENEYKGYCSSVFDCYCLYYCFFIIVCRQPNADTKSKGRASSTP